MVAEPWCHGSGAEASQESGPGHPGVRPGMLLSLLLLLLVLLLSTLLVFLLLLLLSFLTGLALVSGLVIVITLHIATAVALTFTFAGKPPAELSSDISGDGQIIKYLIYPAIRNSTPQSHANLMITAPGMLR